MQIKKDIIGRENGFIIPILFLVFYFLERVSIFYWIRIVSSKIKPQKEKSLINSYAFPEIWVMVNLLVAVIFYNVAKCTQNNCMLYILLIYSIVRMLEITVYQINVLFFHRMIPDFLEKKEIAGEFKKNGQNGYMIKSSVRTIWMMILNIVEYIFFFATIYVVLGTLLGCGLANKEILESFRVFMGTGEMLDHSKGIIKNVACVESVLGIFLNIICIARVIGLLPAVRERGY